jgi:tRNA (mo5U34)-methyltransferase
MNVLIPFTEGELRNALAYAGFENVEIVAKWNNFITFVARKKAPVLTCKDNMMDSKRKKKKKSSTINDMISTPNLDKLFDGSPPIYLNILDHLDAPSLQSICLKRLEAISNKGGLSKGTLQDYDEIASMILKLPQIVSKKILVNTNELTIGSDDELSPDQLNLFNEIIHKLKPWKKGPLNLFGTKIDTEWRSDWKFERLQKSNKFETLLNDKVICDLGCGNGYYMYRMLEYNPKMVIGIDPNLHAFLEFQLFQRFTKSEDNVGKLQFEFLRGDAMKLFPTTFDVVFCLGVLYHTNDPVGMLRDIYSSMNGGGCLIVDCQGIPGDEPIALFPQKRYANMTGVYFLPTLKALEYWLARANFKNFEVLFAEPLSTDEQRITEWAPVKTSLKESLDMNDMSLTREGYPAPHRFYVKVHK